MSIDKILLEAKNLTRHYRLPQAWFQPPALVRALDGVSFTLNAGRTLAVVGESGCGKSTLARQVAMIEQPTGGQLWIDGVNLSVLSTTNKAQLKRVRPQIQMVFQNPATSLNPRKKIGTILEEPLLLNTPLNKFERIEKSHAMMEKVGLRREFYARYPHMFSGGQRQRIAIARALMLSPKVIVADEPVSALDVSIQAQVLNLLMDLQESSGLAYLFISHNLAVVEHIADEVMVMYLGKVVEHGTKRALFYRPLHPYTQALFASMPRIDSAQRQKISLLRGELPSPLTMPTGCAFHTRCPYAIDRCRNEVPLLQAFDGRWVACHRVAEISV